jgi:hypothetical protein
MVCSLGFRVDNSGFRIQGFGFRVLGFGFRAYGSRLFGHGLGVQGFRVDLAGAPPIPSSPPSSALANEPRP